MRNAASAEGARRPQSPESALFALSPSGLPLRRKLAVGHSDDPAERDAEGTAERVLADGRAPGRCACGLPAGPNGLCAACRAAQSHVSRSSTGPAPAQAPPIVGAVLRSAGRPLDRETRAYFEPRFGIELSSVRLHDDMRAAESARAVNARAYAVGDDVVLGPGAPPLGSTDGRRLLAHELAHVAHEGRGAPRAVRRQTAAHGHESRNPVWSCERPRGAPIRGKGRERPTGALRFLTDRVLGGRFWELFEFEVDRSYVQDGHVTYIQSNIVKPLKQMIDDGADVMLVGEASTTASFEHNLHLSIHRAACMKAVLTRELRHEGLSDPTRILPPWGLGESLSRVRHLGQDEVEDPEDRKVTVIAVQPAACSVSARTRRSQMFHIATACASPFSVAINIGDISDPLNPTYRTFQFVHGAKPGGCRFLPTESEGPVWTPIDYRLAIRDPDDWAAPSDFQGPAVIAVSALPGLLLGTRSGFRLPIAGTTEPDPCTGPGSLIAGYLEPIGPVVCGAVPAPSVGDCKEEEEKGCTDAVQTAPAKKFGAVLARVGYGKSLKDLGVVGLLLDQLGFSAIAGGSLVVIGTMEDDDRPRILRAFAFVGGAVRGTSGWDKQVAVIEQVESTQPRRLATRDPDKAFAPSDFDTWTGAKLVIKGDRSSEERLEVDGMTFSFPGFFCNGGSERTIFGGFHGVLPVWCRSIHWLTRFHWTPNCNEECPEERRLASHNVFTFRVGRAALSSIPAVGRRLADAYGCEIVAAYLNIGAQTDDKSERIYREFLFIGRREDCPYDVAQRGWTESFIVPRRLAIEHPDERFYPADFTGGALLDSGGTLTVAQFDPAAFYRVTLPGAYEATCSGKRQVAGVVVPLDVVRCGDVPAPPHSRDVDTSDLDRCRTYERGNDYVLREIARLRAGDYDPHIALITHPPGLAYPEIDSIPDLKRSTPDKRRTIRDARLVGRSGIVGHPKVVTFVDMEIVDYGWNANRRLWVAVRFTSRPCSFDENGKPTFVEPLNCLETIPTAGGSDTLYSVPIPEEKQRKAARSSPRDVLVGVGRTVVETVVPGEAGAIGSDEPHDPGASAR